MELAYNLTRTDQTIFLDHIGRRGGAPDFSILIWTSVLTVVLARAGFLAVEAADSFDWRAAELLAVAGLFAASYLGLAIWQQFGTDDRRARELAGNYRLILTPAGISVSRRNRHSFIPWGNVTAFEATVDYWYLYTGARSGIIVPKVVADQSPADFAEEIRGLWAAHTPGQSQVLPACPAHEKPLREAMTNLWANLAGGFRFANGAPAELASFRPSAIQFALLLVLRAFALALADYWSAIPQPEFNWFSPAQFSLSAALFALSGTVIAGFAAGANRLLEFLIVVAAAQLAPDVLYLCLHEWLSQADDSGRWAAMACAYLAWVVWTLAIVFRAAATVFGLPKPAALLPVGFFALFNLVLDHSLPDQRWFYSRPEAAAQMAKGPAINGEDVIYRQPDLLAEATGKLAAERPGVVDLYFVGFGGQADEQVFAHETEFAKDLFDRRFDTAGRSVALVNSAGTVNRLPLANRHNLDTVLQAMAKRMNPTEDVLFLFLTSHGSKDHRLSVDFSPLPLDDIPASTLKEILDRAGIRNRVIVVSACYSGGFLDVLKNDSSLILTAASRDRPSFGCGTESEFTYFGDAFFVRALQDTRSFIDAFGKARSWIETREKREGKEPSNPQLFVGPAIVPRLKALETRTSASAKKS
jgi:hypothetical protein